MKKELKTINSKTISSSDLDQINSGIYILELELSKKISIKHKTLGSFTLEKGYYYYCGSAQRYLSNRIIRHIRKDKPLHWHIDYLTTNSKICMTNIFIIPEVEKIYECKLTDLLLNDFNLEIPVKNFGSSDCRSCKAHLLYNKCAIDYNQFLSLYQSMVRFIPSSKETC